MAGAEVWPGMRGTRRVHQHTIIPPPPCKHPPAMPPPPPPSGGTQKASNILQSFDKAPKLTHTVVLWCSFVVQFPLPRGRPVTTGRLQGGGGGTQHRRVADCPQPPPRPPAPPPMLTAQ